MHENCGNSFINLSQRQEMIPLHIELSIAKYPSLCTIFFKTSTWYLQFMLYHAVAKIFWDTWDFPPIFMCKLCSGGLKLVCLDTISLNKLMDNKVKTLNNGNKKDENSL